MSTDNSYKVNPGESETRFKNPVYLSLSADTFPGLWIQPPGGKSVRFDLSKR